MMKYIHPYALLCLFVAGVTLSSSCSPDGKETSKYQGTEYVPEGYVISDGDGWCKFNVTKNIAEGSALDFSGMGLQDGPAGKYGWLKAVRDHFEFENLPGVEQRFCGVNICSSANFPTRPVADEFVERLVRLGYNALRIHHYDTGWLTEEKRDRLDYLLAAAYKKGIYVTVDLYTSRSVSWAELGSSKSGSLSPSQFKLQVLTTEKGYNNWEKFAGDFMTHVNPYTGRAAKDEPGMPLICLLNEGSQLPSSSGLSSAEISELQAEFHKKGSEYLRSIGVRALLTDDNCGNDHAEGHGLTTLFDYVDNHGYVDHPSFPEKSNELPSTCGNTHVGDNGGPYLFTHGLTDNSTKPYTITEWNYCVPGKYRSMAGLVTGAMGSYQGWDGMWRFAYSHKEENLVDNDNWSLYYFDINNDPIGQATDRLAVCLFLRRDVTSASELEMNWLKRNVRLVTERSCGFFDFDGNKLEAGPLSAEIKGCPASIWISSLDGKRIEESGRMLLVHATDAQGNNCAFRDSSRGILTYWGKGAVVEIGSAAVSLRLNAPEAYSVFELDSSGQRVRSVETVSDNGALSFDVCTSGPSGGRIYYEIIRN